MEKQFEVSTSLNVMLCPLNCAIIIYHQFGSTYTQYE